MHRHAAFLQLDTQLVQRQIAILFQPLAHEAGVIGQLAAAHSMALSAWLERARLGAQLHQIVHKTRRHPEMPRRITVAVTLVNIRRNTLTQRHRMWLAHRGSPSTAMNHQISKLGIPNPLNRDTL
jgi:hypothetical protein